MVKYLIVGDLHGKMPKIHYKDFDAIICPGDIMGDKARPYIIKAFFHKLKTGEDQNWQEMVGKERAKKLIKESAEQGRKTLERLNNFGVPVYVVPGNWDQAREENRKWGYRPWDRILRGMDHVIDCDHALLNAGEHQLIGYGLVSGPEYPQTAKERKRHTPAELKDMKKSYDQKYRALAKLFRKAKKPTLFIPHNVPYGTLDTIVDEKNPRHGTHMGSAIARDLVREFRPVACIGGHMHEHHDAKKRGKTTVINAGFGGKVNTLLEVEGSKVKNIEFWNG